MDNKPPLRVLFLSPYFLPYRGGIERAIEQLSCQLLRSPSVEAVGVLTTKYAFPRLPRPSWTDRETTAGGIEIFRLRGYPQGCPPFYSVPLVWFSPLRIRGFVEEFQPDIVHFVGDGWFWGHFWAWFWRRGRAGFVFTPSFHTLSSSRGWIRPINWFICRGMDSVISLSRQEAQQVRHAYHVPAHKQGVIGWGASPLSASPALRDEDTLNILCVGRLGQHKGQMWLLDLYRKARPRFQHPTRLVLVGQDEGAETALRQTARASGLEDEVAFTGELTDSQLAAAYSQADIFTLFSQYEAFGLAFFEAMVVGVPVLTHDVGANRELLGRGAAVVPRYDQEAAADSLVRLVNDDDYRRRLGWEGRDYTLDGFTWESVAEKYLEVYQRVRRRS